MNSSSNGIPRSSTGQPGSGRICRVIVVAAILFSVAISTGCRTRNASYRRETALLRAEILDLEDQLYALKAQMHVVPATAEMDTFYAPGLDGVFAGGVVEMGDCCSPDDIVYDSHVYPADIFVDGQIIDGQIIDSQPVYGGVVQPEGMAPRNVAPLVEPEEIQGRPQAPTPIRQPLSPPDGRAPEQTRLPGWEPNDNSNYLDDFNQDVFLDPVESARRTPAYQRPVARNYEQNPVDVSYQRNERPNADRVSQRVAGIGVDPQVTRGANVDGSAGDEGVELLIQPRNVQGAVVAQPGRMTVSLIDPGAPPIAQRLGMWEFSSDEIDLFAVKSPGDGRGYLLHLPWELNTPSNRRLLVFVRYITSDGRRLETSHEMQIVPPPAGYSPRDPEVEAWSRRDSRWQDGSSQSSDDLVAERENDAGWSQSSEGVPARPASTSDGIQRPRWRPVR